MTSDKLLEDLTKKWGLGIEEAFSILGISVENGLLITDKASVRIKDIQRMEMKHPYYQTRWDVLLVDLHKHKGVGITVYLCVYLPTGKVVLLNRKFYAKTDNPLLYKYEGAVHIAKAALNKAIGQF
jgi:hypothetical protein